MKFYALTDIGKKRELNEDSYFIPEGTGYFCAVADGMGGHNAGEVASALAVSTVSEILADRKITPSLMNDAVERANERIFTHAIRRPECRGMGTTLTVFAVEGMHAFVAHVGDSRCYRVRDRRLKAVTRDHSYVQEMVDQGKITRLEAMNSPYRNYITRAVGTHETVRADIFSMTLQPGDAYLLCSDGLTNHVSDQDIIRVSADTDLSWKEKLRILVDMALENGGSDNITAVYAVYTEDDK